MSENVNKENMNLQDLDLVAIISFDGMYRYI